MNSYSLIKTGLKVTQLTSSTVNNFSAVYSNTAQGHYHLKQAREIEREGYRKDKAFAAQYEDENYKRSLDRMRILYGRNDESIPDLRDRLNVEEAGKFDRLLQEVITIMETKIKQQTQDDGVQFDQIRPQGATCLMM